jgi:hypothetical protein
MAIGDLTGFARIDPKNPIALAECDRCRQLYLRTDLVWQYQWSGARLINTGLRVCKRKCLDIPFEQYRVLILPGDPIPVKDARPSPDTTPPAYVGLAPPTTPGNFGFTPLTITPPDTGTYPPVTKADVLAAIPALTGIPNPPVLDRSITFAAASTTQALMPANSQRQWLALYSPVNPPAGFSMATAAIGSPTTLMFGAGLIWFWANLQGLGQVWQGALTAVGLVAGLPFWAWEGSSAWLSDDLGNVVTDDFGNPVDLT